MIRRAHQALAAVAGTAVLGLVGVVTGPATASTMAPVKGRTWLQEINYYRVGAGLRRVTNDRAWDRGMLNHLRYLAKTPAKYLTGQYADVHLENPKSPYYTRSGAREGSRSDLLLGGASNPLGDIDAWLAAPFHAIGMLRSELTKVAFAERYDLAGLDVLGGLGSGPPDPKPILFPGRGVTTNLTSFTGELPNPLQSCHFTKAAKRKGFGLPLIALLPATPSRTVKARLVRPGGHIERSKADTLCVVDQFTYHSTDKIYGPAGKAILKYDHAVVLIPSGTLTPGRYHATIDDGTKTTYAWTFNVKT
jgi:hypothetical protein